MRFEGEIGFLLQLGDMALYVTGAMNAAIIFSKQLSTSTKP